MIAALSQSATWNVPLRWRFRFVVFLVSMWLRNALRYLKPEPVFLKRFKAPLLDLIFGIWGFPIYLYQYNITRLSYWQTSKRCLTARSYTLFLLFGSQHHNHLSTLNFRKLLNGTDFSQVSFYTLQKLQT